MVLNSLKPDHGARELLLGEGKIKPTFNSSMDGKVKKWRKFWLRNRIFETARFNQSVCFTENDFWLGNSTFHFEHQMSLFLVFEAVFGCKYLAPTSGTNEFIGLKWSPWAVPDLVKIWGLEPFGKKVMGLQTWPSDSKKPKFWLMI